MKHFALALLLFAAPAHAESIVAGLSQNRVSITADFDGSEILVYGAVKRDAPAPDGCVACTPRPNTDAVHIDAAPSFYAVATTGPLASILSDTDDLRYRITLDRAIRAVGAATETGDPAEFIAAMERIRIAERRYRILQGAVEFTEDTLFRADIVLPANLTEGEYTVRMFLLRDGRVIDAQDRVIGVRKEGLERFLFNLAQDQPLIYGLLSILLAVVAGWGASAAFRLVRA